MTAPLAPGQEIGGFRLEERIHTGGLAELWRVARADIAFPIVMKIPLMRPGESPLTIVGFEAEQMILPRLSGVHVPRFVTAGDFARPYIVMELIEGRTLKSRLDELPLPHGEVAAIGAAIAGALHDIHRQQVVHLDLKPSNVLLRASGDAVLIDFGLSHHLQLPDLPAEEFAGPLGTGVYISPEQILGVRDDSRSDLYALGVMLYFLATGERPFGEPASMREWRRRLYRDPRPPRGWAPGLPPWLQEVILRCMEIDVAERYQTAAQVAFDLLHPDQVVLTGRSSRTERTGAATAVRRWLARLRARSPVQEAVRSRPGKAPLILAAIDLAPELETLAAALRLTVRRILQTEPGARLACVNVLKLSAVRLDRLEDAQGRNLHLQRLAELKHWAGPLETAAERITYHVFEAHDPAAALVEFARRNHVDHIVMGARGSSSLRRYLGSVSSHVVAEAPCTVTVVRGG
jgi:nucleotide-binding universal stress UspA family protein